MNKFLSILAIAAVTISITSLAAPAQAGKFSNLLRAITRPAPEPTPVQAPSDSNNTPVEATPTEEVQPTPVSVAPMKKVGIRPECIKVNGNDIEAIEKDSEESKISIGRRFMPAFQKVHIGWSQHELTCTTRTFIANGTVGFAYAIADNSELESARVTVYVGGQERINRIVKRGQIQSFNLNMSDSSSYAIVVKSINGSGYIHLGKGHSHR